MTDDCPDERQDSQAQHHTEALLGNLLRIGVLTATVVVAAGGLLYLVRYGAELPKHQKFHGEPAELRDVPSIVQAAWDGGRRGLIQLGLILLIATPVARVAFSLLLFLRQRDSVYVAVTLAVLAALAYSLQSAF